MANPYVDSYAHLDSLIIISIIQSGEINIDFDRIGTSPLSLEEVNFS